METETLTGLAERIKRNLSNGCHKESLSIVDEESSESMIKENPWEIIPTITDYIKKDVKELNIELFDTSCKLLNVVTDKAYPDDVILLLIRDIECTKDETTLLTLLKPLGKCMKSLPKKRLNYLAWCFNAIQKFLENISQIEDQEDLDHIDYNNYKKLLMYIYKALAQFYGSFVEDFRVCVNADELECKDLLIKYIVQLLGKPFAYLDINSTTNGTNDVENIAEILLDFVTDLHPDVYQLLELKYNYTDDEYIKINNTALGVFFYYFLFKGFHVARAPKVYNHLYIFVNCFEYAADMIATSYQYLIERGVSLIAALLNMVKDQELPHQLLDLKHHPQFCRSIVHIVIYNTSECHRRDCLELFKTYFHSFDSRGKYLLLLNLMRNVMHKGFLGFLITLYKDLLNRALNNNEDLYYYSHSKLRNLLRFFCHLPVSKSTDLMEVSDKVIATLNFIRFAFLRDKENRTGIWNCYADLQEGFFKELDEQLGQCKISYKQRLSELKNDSYVDSERKKKSNFTVTVKDMELPNITHVEEINSLMSALTGLDVMESLLQRVKIIGAEHQNLCL